uniref:Wntless-like transmembrane domain-containing protein n=1 Tax=Entamoeba invadens TaxID=33085 RepID=S0B1K1_ENTIV|nr:hypothetical protein [Entamoeba invadens]
MKAEGFVVDNLGCYGKSIILVLWGFWLLTGFVLSIGEVFQKGTIVEEMVFDPNNQTKLTYFGAFSINRTYQAVISGKNTSEIEEMMNSGREVSDVINGIHHNMFGEVKTFSDYETGLSVYNQFQATSLKPFVKKDERVIGMRDITVSGIGYFWWGSNTSENFKKATPTNLTYTTKCSFQACECAESDFVSIQSVKQESYVFLFGLDPTMYSFLIFHSKRGKPEYSFFKITFSLALSVVSIVFLIVYLGLYLLKALLTKADNIGKSVYLNYITFVMLIALPVFNNPIVVGRYFYNADWMIYVNDWLFSVFEVALVAYIYTHISVTRLKVFEEKFDVISTLTFCGGIVMYLTFYSLYFVMYSLPTNNSPFAVITDSMSIGLLFEGLSSFILFLLYGWVFVLLLFLYSQVHPPLYKERVVWFSTFTAILLVVVVLHFLFFQDVNPNTPMTKLCLQLISNLYIFTIAYMFFPSPRNNTDAYGVDVYVGEYIPFSLN